MRIRTYCVGFYNFCVSIPDRLYPFAAEIEGERVRWRRAYVATLARLQADRGFGAYGVKLIAYRSFFHVIGSILFILFATLVSRDLFGSDAALYVLFALAAFGLAFQEFYLQPKTFGQLRVHGMIDLLSWVIPFALYLYVHPL
jgi:hypothetical protein